MAWRVMNSLLVLRDQANEAAPNRSKGADGTICDQNHPTDSDHCPHNVPGVGSEMVTALDLTHDPAHDFDSYLFAEVLRQHRDKRIKYVISNHRIFSSYSTSSRAAWTWGSYNGTDQHTGHVHISVLDEPISDTSTAWNLEGFTVTYTEAEMRGFPWQYKDDGQPSTHSIMVDPNGELRTGMRTLKQLLVDLDEVNNKLDQILNLLNQGGGGGGVLPTPVPPPVYHFEGTATPQA